MKVLDDLFRHCYYRWQWFRLLAWTVYILGQSDNSLFIVTCKNFAIFVKISVKSFLCVLLLLYVFKGGLIFKGKRKRLSAILQRDLSTKMGINNFKTGFYGLFSVSFVAVVVNFYFLLVTFKIAVELWQRNEPWQHIQKAWGSCMGGLNNNHDVNEDSGEMVNMVGRSMRSPGIIISSSSWANNRKMAQEFQTWSPRQSIKSPAGKKEIVSGWKIQ